MGKERDAIEAEANLICPHCESPIERVQAVKREFADRSLPGIRVNVIAIACPTCRKVLGFYQP
jgi:hypothetical protein